jgi:hypothetical protein
MTSCDAPRPPSHGDLIALAHDLRQATIVGDSEQLHADLARLRTALVHHLSDEQTRMPDELAATGTIIRNGQRRLLRLVDDVVFDVLRDKPTCTCLVRAAEIELALRRQARLEATLLHHA